jgi:hypothetical protein
MAHDDDVLRPEDNDGIEKENMLPFVNKMIDIEQPRAATFAVKCMLLLTSRSLVKTPIDKLTANTRNTSIDKNVTN